MYGQRAGALVGISANTSVIDEFNDVVLYSARAAWSNINRGAMTLLTTIQNDAALCRQFEAERHAFYETIRRRAAVFMTEAKECQLAALPYQSGFFISIPAKNSALVCDKLADSLIFAGPLAMDIADEHHIAPKRVASLLDIFACAVHGMAPHGGGMLTLSGFYAALNPLLVVKYNVYCIFLMIAAIVTIQFGLMRTKEEKEYIQQQKQASIK